MTPPHLEINLETCHIFDFNASNIYDSLRSNMQNLYLWDKGEYDHSSFAFKKSMHPRIGNP